MIDVKVYKADGTELETISVDEALFGGEVNYSLLKQALVMYHANQRVGTAATKSRGMKAGSTKKLFRQKGTGNARVGNRRTHKRVGGGVAFAKVARDFSHRMPKKMRRQATASALLAKLQSGSVIVVDSLSFDAPKTKEMVQVLKNLDVTRSCLLTVGGYDANILKSINNIPKAEMIELADINAWSVCKSQKLIFTKDAFTQLIQG